MVFEGTAQFCREEGLLDLVRAWAEQSILLDPVRTSSKTLLASIGDVEVQSPPTFLRLRTPSGPKPNHTLTSQAIEEGSIHFEDITTRAGLDYVYHASPTGNLFLADTMGGGVSLIDYDEDGWLDVYFIGGCRLPINPSEDPQPNKLFRNKADGTFEDVTSRAGVAGHGYGMGCAIGDYDNDGHDDIFVTGLDRTIL